MAINILIHNSKGGVGKSTLSILASEYFLHRGYSVHLMDASGNPTAKKFIAGSKEAGRNDEWSPGSADVTLIDTKGIPASAAPFYDRASLILIPFKPNPDDAEESLDVYGSLNKEHQIKAVFIANVLRPLGNTKEQQHVIDGVKEVVAEEGGLLLFGLLDRPAVYPRIMMGLPKNFFDLDIGSTSFEKAQQEAKALFGQVAEILDLKPE